MQQGSLKRNQEQLRLTRWRNGSDLAVLKTILTTLSYSGGKQSHAILEMVLRGEIEKPESFLVLNADPGMENENSYPHIEKMRARCDAAGIAFKTARTTLCYDLTTFKERGLTHLDQPPYWTRNRVTGKIGRLKQKCTGFYKVAPMRRMLRQHLYQEFGVSMVTKRLPKVETWIGFAMDEKHRADKQKPDVKYISLRYPLIELGLTKAQTVGWYMKAGVQQPPPSVCNACFANGLAFFEDMYMNRPNDWDQAVMVDDYIRDMRQIGIEDECFVSASMVPLRDLPDRNFLRGTAEGKKYQCNSGVCFI